MSLFQCGVCGCIENTALSGQGIPDSTAKWFDWAGIEDRQGKRLCSEHAPTKYASGEPTEYGQWHGRFTQKYLPMGMFKTAQNGNLEHIETGEQDYKPYLIEKESI